MKRFGKWLLAIAVVVLISEISSWTGRETQKPALQSTSARQTEAPREKSPAVAPTKASVSGLSASPVYQKPLGTAGKLEGTIAVISIFADDAQTHWDFSSEVDLARYSEAYYNLGTAAEYLTREAAKYGKKITFLYDWMAEHSLYYTASFQDTLVRADGGKYRDQQDWVIRHVDTEKIRTTYGADHFVYIFFFNTPTGNGINPRSTNYQPGYEDVHVELTNMYTGFASMTAPPATYAHEILHAFGAEDLYYASQSIPQAYVDHLRQTGSRDIMYTVNSESEITVEFSDLDAYYVGLTSRPSEAETWGLGASQHQSR